MKKNIAWLMALFILLSVMESYSQEVIKPQMACNSSFVHNKRIYHKKWIDFNKYGRKDIDEKTTFFPTQIGVGATWDEELVYRIGQVTATETKALGYTNIYSPILDLCRDPSWVRTCEAYSENPFLVVYLGKQRVKGIQDQGVTSTSKHF